MNDNKTLKFFADKYTNMITRSAKEFLIDSNRSSNYIKAADKTVLNVMMAIEAKINVKDVTNEPA